MNHYVYQITNTINGKIYIGKRSCKCDIDKDIYFGSGVRLKSAIKKYGKENFTKTIIDVCESPEMAYELEALIVDSDFLKRLDTYNLKFGGVYGGVLIHTAETKLKMSNNNARAMLGKTPSIETKLKMSLANIGHQGFLGKKHTNEARIKISLNNANKKDEQITDKIIENLLNSDIDFKSFGWVGKAAIIIGITPQKVNSWMKRNMSEFYETNCFKRK